MTECSITLPFPVPLSSLTGNSASSGRKMTERYKAWRKEAGWLLKQQRPHKFKGEVEICIEIRPPDKRKRDGDNLVKSVFDLLTAHCVIRDDNLSIIAKHSVERVDDIDAPECRIVIRDREGDEA